MAEPCGCGVFIADENVLQGMGDTVKHCPMHAAAGDMLAALEASDEALSRVAPPSTGPDDDADGWACIQIRDTNRRVLALARSGAPRPDVLGDALKAIEDVWPFVGHHHHCATQLDREVCEGAECDCGLDKVLLRGNIRKAREAAQARGDAA